ncbi:MAG: large conductance mechanosensitive channel protein MscL [Candidatus Coproplasma sp.]
MSKIKQLLQDFKKFISRGNVVDMAVAVIIGGAFSAIVTALTNKILRPLIDWVAGGGEAIGLKTMLKTVYIDGDATKGIDLTNSIYLDWGALIMAIIDFLLIAIVLFIIIKLFMGLQNARNGLTSAEAKSDRKRARELKKEKGVSYKEAMAQVAAEKAAAAEEEAKNAPAPAPTTDELLTQIRDLLAAQNNSSKSE